VLLRVMSLVADAGTSLAVPVAVELKGEDKAIDRERTRDAEAQARKWREEGRLGLPEYESEPPPRAPRAEPG
jgi:hypothetical protein